MDETILPLSAEYLQENYPYFTGTLFTIFYSQPLAKSEKQSFRYSIITFARWNIILKNQRTKQLVCNKVNKQFVY